jgi:hypothetical protein
MMYCKLNTSFFCFPCTLFGKQNNVLSNTKKGYSEWKNLHPYVEDQ